MFVALKSQPAAGTIILQDMSIYHVHLKLSGLFLLIILSVWWTLTFLTGDPFQLSLPTSTSGSEMFSCIILISLPLPVCPSYLWFSFLSACIFSARSGKRQLKVFSNLNLINVYIVDTSSSLSCPRLTVHKHLMMSFILFYFSIIIYMEPYVTFREGLDYRQYVRFNWIDIHNIKVLFQPWICKSILVLQVYSQMAAANW